MAVSSRRRQRVYFYTHSRFGCGFFIDPWLTLRLWVFLLAQEAPKQKGGKMNGNGNGSVVHKENLTTTVAFLDAGQIDFLDKLNKEYFLKFGYHLSRNRILTELVNCLMKMNLDVSELDADKEDLCQYILRKAKDAHKICV